MLNSGGRSSSNVVAARASLTNHLTVVALAADKLDLCYICTERNTVAVTKDLARAQPSGNRRRVETR
jgi:hypothetical protein